MVLCVAQPGLAAEIDTGTDAQLRWDFSTRASLGVRTEGQNARLLENPNGDDGDRAFAPGLMSERIDLLSTIDLTLPATPIGDAGIDLSAQGFYDAAYHRRTDNRSPATFNPVSVPNTEFPKATQTVDGGMAELLTAAVHDRFSLAGLPVTLRLGRQTLLWGESLFSAENGIAAGQAPVDENKSLSQPSAQAREVFLPVAQAVVSITLRPGLSLEAYLQGEWRPDRLPGVASYFSTTDFAGPGGERLLANPSAFLRLADRRPQNCCDQFGVSVQARSGHLDFGFYALQFDSKSADIFAQPGGGAGDPGRYFLLYPRGIGLLGASTSFYVGDANVAGEISLRTHMPLVSRLALLQAGSPAPGAAYPVGDTVHAQLSVVSSLPPGRWWNDASVEAEILANDVLGGGRDAAALAPGRQNFASAFRALFTPTYFQVFSRLDLSVPMGVGWNFLNSSSVLASQVAHTGDAEIGVQGTWRSVWIAALTYTHFLGSPARQVFADRDFVILSLSRTF